MINLTDLIHFNKSLLRHDLHEMADEFCIAVIGLSVASVQMEYDDEGAKCRYYQHFNKITEIRDTVFENERPNIYLTFEGEAARIGEAARLVYKAEREAAKRLANGNGGRQPCKYLVYFTNFMYYSDEQFNTPEAAIAYGKDKGFGCRIETGEQVAIAAWSIIGGLRWFIEREEQALVCLSS